MSTTWNQKGGRKKNRKPETIIVQHIINIRNRPQRKYNPNNSTYTDKDSEHEILRWALQLCHKLRPNFCPSHCSHHFSSLWVEIDTSNLVEDGQLMFVGPLLRYIRHHFGWWSHNVSEYCGVSSIKTWGMKASPRKHIQQHRSLTTEAYTTTA